MSDEFVALQVKVVELEGRVNMIVLDLQHLTGSTNARLSEIEGTLGSIKKETGEQSKVLVVQSDDIQLIKLAVVHGQASIWGKRVLYGLMSGAIIVAGSIMWGYPQTVPIVIRLLERLATGSSH